MRRRPPRRRRGLTLLEVVVSMFIFLIAITAIWQLISAASERATDVGFQTQTSLGCQSKLAEVMIGAQELAEVQDQPYSDAADENRTWGMKPTKSKEWAGLWDVKIWVEAKTPSGRVIKSSIAQMVLEPTMRGSTMDRATPTPTPVPTEDAPAPKK